MDRPPDLGELPADLKAALEGSPCRFARAAAVYYVLASSDPDAVAFRCEVRAEHRRLARRRGKILQLGQQMRRMRQRKGARRG